MEKTERCADNLEVKLSAVVNGKKISTPEEGENLSATKENGRKFELPKRHSASSKPRPYYLLHGTPVKIERRIGKFMVFVTSDRFRDLKMVFTSDLQTDLWGIL